MRQRIGRYDILESIASGGFATVYRAQDTQLGRVVALKVLHPHMAENPQYVERFLREARMAASLSHPNVVVIYEVGQEEGTHFISMEYLPASLDGLMQRRGRLPVPEALNLVRQIALGLQAAHQQGVVHRDLKPQNVLLTQDGTPKVTDFGIARASELSTMTASGLVMGTPHYMSPEQAQGQRVDARSDIYSLGCVLYQLLTGALPFEATTPYEVIRRHIEMSPRSVRQRQPQLPATVDQLVGRCMAKEPSHRYQSAVELVSAIDGLMEQAAASARQQPTAAPVPSMGATVVGQAAGRPVSSEQVRTVGGRGKWWLAVTAGVILLAAVVGLAGVAAMRAGNWGSDAQVALPPSAGDSDQVVVGPTTTPTSMPIRPTTSFSPLPASTQAPTSTPTPTEQAPTVPSSLSFKVEFLSKWGSKGSGDGQFQSPLGIAVDERGNVYVADFYNHRVQKFDSRWVFVGQWGTKGSGDGQFNSPAGLAVDSAGNIYVADYGNSRVQKFNSNGVFLTKWGSPGTYDGQFLGAIAVAVDSVGNVYVADQQNNRIQKFDSSGVFLAKWGSQGSSEGEFQDPAALAVDSSGNVYVVDRYNYRVQKFNSQGSFLTSWGTQGSGNGQFQQHSGITVDSLGNVYVADAANRRIQKFDSNGVFLAKWGSVGTSDGQFNAATDIAVDPAGYIYVVDAGNNRVQVFRQVSSH